MTASPVLPDELVLDILSGDEICRPNSSAFENIYSDREHYSGLFSRSYSKHNRRPTTGKRRTNQLNVLLVCRQWYKIGIPLFYETVNLYSKIQVAELLATLKKHPQFAAYVKRLRIQTAYSAAIGGIFNHCRGLKELCLSFDVTYKDNIKSLMAGLDVVNPEVLYVNDPNDSCGTGKSRNVQNYLEKVCEKVKGWSNLVSAYTTVCIIIFN